MQNIRCKQNFFPVAILTVLRLFRHFDSDFILGSHLIFSSSVSNNLITSCCFGVVVAAAALLLFLLLYYYYYYYTPCVFYNPGFPDGFSLESKWQQVSSALWDSSQYSDLSQQRCSLDGLDLSSDFQFFQPKPLGTVPSTPSTTSITVILMLHSFISSLAKFSFFLLFSFFLFFFFFW